MSPLEISRSAFRGVTANKLRSALTTLGLLIGVSAVIILLAVGNGSAKSVQASIEQLGTNTITVFSGGAGRGAGATSTRNQSLTVAVARQLADPSVAPDIKSVSPQVSATVTAVYNGVSHSTSVVGTYPSYFEATNSPIGTGTYFTNDDVLGSRRVVVIGQTVATDLFDTADPLNQQIAIGGVPFTVVGVLKDKGASGPNDANDTMVAPLNTVQGLLSGYGAITSITLQATSPKTVDAATAEATAILDRALKVTATTTGTGRTGGTAATTSTPFRILSQSQLLAARTSTSDTFTILLAAVAAISLLVGGIGVMNIMLVTVTERTREIGIRKALGATRGAILSQFLSEAALLSLIGGLLGVAAGLVGSHFKIVGIDPVIVPVSIPLALGVSVALGLFFGSYPASRAAALRPIQALRYE